MKINRMRTFSSTVTPSGAAPEEKELRKSSNQLERNRRSKLSLMICLQRQASLMDEVGIHVLHSDLLLRMPGPPRLSSNRLRAHISSSSASSSGPLEASV